jgi:hypothetical protein
MSTIESEDPAIRSFTNVSPHAGHCDMVSLIETPHIGQESATIGAIPAKYRAGLLVAIREAS